MITFDIDAERLLTISIAILGVLAVSGIIMIGVVTKRRGSILSLAQSKSSRVISFVLGILFIFFTIAIESYEFFLVTIGLFIYAFGSPVLLAKLQNQPNPDQKFIGTTNHTIIEQDEVPRKIRRFFRSLLKYLSWIGITALLIYGVFLLYVYKPIPENLWTPIVIIGMVLGSLLGSIATLYSIYQLIQRLSK